MQQKDHVESIDRPAEPADGQINHAQQFADGAPLRELIRSKVERFKRRRWGCPLEAADLEQTLAMHVLRRLPQYDPARGGLNGFVARICDHALLSESRRQRAVKRDGNVISLDSPDCPVPACDDDLERIDLRQDVDVVLSKLTDEGREFCDQRADGASLDQIAERCHTSRRQVTRQSQMIAQLFRRHGLGWQIREKSGRRGVRSRR